MEQPGPSTTQTIHWSGPRRSSCLRRRAIPCAKQRRPRRLSRCRRGNRAPRLLFTNVHFPGLHSGVGPACQVRRRWPELALLATSGREPVSLSELPPGTRFIPKPYRANVLFREVAALLQAREYTREHPKRRSEQPSLVRQ